MNKVMFHPEYCQELNHLTEGVEYDVINEDKGGNLYVVGDDGKVRPHATRMACI